MTETETGPLATSFAGVQVADDTVVGDDVVLALYDSTALLGPVTAFPRHIRTALSRKTALRDGELQLVVHTPPGDLLRRSVTPESEAAARTFAARLDAASAELRTS